MKTATVREVRQNFGQLLSWINAGEEIIITLRRKAVARIVPTLPEKSKKPHWPDFKARQKALFGNKVLPGNTVAEERESYQW
jgi:antitoxin (DNA-binding transcriptional repressor) of toxin-antitoxin stability system